MEDNPRSLLLRGKKAHQVVPRERFCFTLGRESRRLKQIIQEGIIHFKENVHAILEMVDNNKLSRHAGVFVPMPGLYDLLLPAPGAMGVWP